MKTKICLLCLAAGSLAYGQACDPAKPAPGDYFVPWAPSSFVSQAILKRLLPRWDHAEDEPSFRKLAWEVYAGITRPQSPHAPSRPVFETWYSTKELMTPGPPERTGQAIFAPSPQSANSTGEGAIINREIRPAFRNLFDRHLYCFVQENALNRSQSLIAYAQSHQRDIDFPRESIALKTAWIYVPVKGCLALPVWNGHGALPMQPIQGPVRWPPNDVRVCGPQHPHCATAAGRRSSGASCVDHFHSLSIEQTAKASQRRPSSGSLAAPDLSQRTHVAIMIGLHVAFKTDLPNWLWATFWWHPNAKTSKFAADAPPLPAPWSNYRMDVTFDVERPYEYDGKPNVAFNPYIELVGNAEKATASNCMACHRRATFPTFSLKGKGTAAATIERGWQATLENGTNFHKMLKTGFLWTLALEQN